MTSLAFAPNSALISIGHSTFSGCTEHRYGAPSVCGSSLGGALDFPASLETIGDYAFESTGVTSLAFATGSVLTRGAFGRGAFGFVMNAGVLAVC